MYIETDRLVIRYFKEEVVRYESHDVFTYD